MTRPNAAVLAPLAAVLTLTLTRCEVENGPTGWIPRDGVVTGTVTLTNSSALPSAPVSGALDLSAPAVTLALPVPDGLNAFRSRRHA
ncbi:MAG TPA: hypothetical protein VE714_07425, partial [Gemmatimonadales bacterium]|nr:hypothetical protein [Gemmatimonadales bacterium]